MKTHESYMSECLILGEQAMQLGNAPVGSLLVQNGKIIGVGKEAGRSGNDVTRHAEIEAIKNALEDNHQLRDAVLYTTHEPCVMCSYVIRYHKIKTVIFGASSVHLGGFTSKFNVLSTEEIPHWKKAPNVIAGVLEDQCRALSSLYNKLKSHEVSK